MCSQFARFWWFFVFISREQSCRQPGLDSNAESFGTRLEPDGYHVPSPTSTMLGFAAGICNFFRLFRGRRLAGEISEFQDSTLDFYTVASRFHIIFRFLKFCPLLTLAYNLPYTVSFETHWPSFPCRAPSFQAYYVEYFEGNSGFSESVSYLEVCRNEGSSRYSPSRISTRARRGRKGGW